MYFTILDAWTGFSLFFQVKLLREDNLFDWEVAIFGPPGTLYEGGYFKGRFSLSLSLSLSLLRRAIQQKIMWKAHTCTIICRDWECESFAQYFYSAHEISGRLPVQSAIDPISFEDLAPERLRERRPVHLHFARSRRRSPFRWGFPCCFFDRLNKLSEGEGMTFGRSPSAELILWVMILV